MVPPSWMDLAIRKPVDKASPKLMESLCTGKYFSNAVLTITAPDGTDISLYATLSATAGNGAGQLS